MGSGYNQPRQGSDALCGIGHSLQNTHDGPAAIWSFGARISHLSKACLGSATGKCKSSLKRYAAEDAPKLLNWHLLSHL